MKMQKAARRDFASNERGGSCLPPRRACGSTVRSRYRGLTVADPFAEPLAETCTPPGFAERRRMR
jgi:hypothetical protein